MSEHKGIIDSRIKMQAVRLYGTVSAIMIMISMKVNHDEAPFPHVGVLCLESCFHPKLIPHELVMLIGEWNGFLPASHPVCPDVCIC